MASTDELLGRIQILEAKINGAVLLPKTIKEYIDPDVRAGDKVFGKSGNALIGDQFFADCINAPISSVNDLANIFQY